MRHIPVLVIACVFLLFPNLSAAQTPVNYIPVGEFQPDYLGAIRGARVVYEHLDREKGFLGVTAFEFEDANSASAAMRSIADDWIKDLDDAWDMKLKLHETSSRNVGDETLALAGSFRPSSGIDRVHDEAVVVVRRDRFVWLGTGSRTDEHTPLSDVVNVLEKLVNREPEGVASLIDGAWQGGVFNMLPTLAEIPEGYTQMQFVQAVAEPVASPNA